jgi:CheY-like chemotaxis protein
MESVKETRMALVVEDDDAIRFTLVSTLRDEGYAVIEALSGDQALDLLPAASRLDLLLTDVSMPGRVDGFELSHRVRGALPDAAIVVFSGKSTPTLSDLPEGASFLQKPFSMGTLLLTVRSVVSE